MVVIIYYCYIGCDEEVTTLRREQREGHDVDIFIIQKVQDTVIHLEVDEEQWKITQGSKRQAKWAWSPRTMSGLRLPDTPHAQHIQRICCQPEKTTLHGGQSRSWSAEQGKENKRILYISINRHAGAPSLGC